MMAMFRIVSLGITFNHNLEAVRDESDITCPDRIPRKGIIGLHDVDFPFTGVPSLSNRGLTSKPDAATAADNGAPGPRLGGGIHREDGNRRTALEGGCDDQRIQWRPCPILYRDHDERRPIHVSESRTRAVPVVRNA